MYICVDGAPVMKLHTLLARAFGCPKNASSFVQLVRFVVKFCTLV